MSQATIYATQSIHCYIKPKYNGILYFIWQPSLVLLTWLQSSGDSEAGQPAGLCVLLLRGRPWLSGDISLLGASHPQGD